MSQSIKHSINESISQPINQSHSELMNESINQPINPSISQSNSQPITQSWLQQQIDKSAGRCFSRRRLAEENTILESNKSKSEELFQNFLWTKSFVQPVSNPAVCVCVCTGSGITPDRNPIPSRSDRNSQSYSRIFWACVWILRSRSFGSNRSYKFCSMNCCQYRYQATQLPIPDSYLFLDS